MRLSDGVFLAAVQLTRRRMRAFLCALSVAVGVIAMVLIASLGTFGQTEVQKGLETMGLRGLTVYVSEGAPGQKLTEKQADSIAQALPQVSAAMPVKAKTGTYRTSSKSGSAVFLGVGNHLGEVMGLTLVAGRLPSTQEILYGRRVAVIDENLAKKLYQRTNITGKSLRFTVDNREDYFDIIGVIKAQTGTFGSVFGNLIPTLIYVPYFCVASKSESVDQIFIQCIGGVNLNDTGAQITDFLSRREQIAGTISVQNVSGAMDEIQGMVHLVTLLFLIVASISFTVAMLGVLSGMLSATHEKTAEIGIFMAIGARGRDIAHIFLLQSILICLLGGAGGIGCAALALAVASRFIGVELAIPFGFTCVVLVLSAFCGALAGVIPAVWAARLHPVDAMRK